MTNRNVDNDTMVQPNKTVYVIDDNIEVRKSLHFLLSSSDIMAWPFASAIDFIEHLPTLVPAPILLDIRMPEMDGLQLLQVMKTQAVNWPVIVMTAHGNVKTAVQSIKLGAIDFLEKPFKPEILDLVLADAFEILNRMQIDLQNRDDARHLLRQLSKRESEITTILTEGVPNKVAAQRLGLSVRTVEMHRGNALAKLGLRNIVELTALLRTADIDPEMNESRGFNG